MSEKKSPQQPQPAQPEQSEIITKKFFLYFPKCETEKPIVYQLVKDYNLIINLFRAKVTPEEEGYLVLDMTGKTSDIENALRYIHALDVQVSETRIGLRWDEKKCTHCGNCLPHCPARALYIIDSASRRIAFDEKKCIECLSCLKNCPFEACASLF